MCLIMLILLRVVTSKSMIPRPCFQQLLHCFLPVLLLLALLPLLFQITQTTQSTVLLHLMLLITFAKSFSGVAELTTQLLRLIGILWLPLCRINKLGYTYPRRLLRSPTFVGHQFVPVARWCSLSLLIQYSVLMSGHVIEIPMM